MRFALFSGLLVFSPLKHLGAEDIAPARLIACPDCQHEVSRRAVSCPHCGCPGEAIATAVRALHAAEFAARARPVVSVTTDVGAGHGVVVATTDATHVLFDAALLAGAQSLVLATVPKAEPVPYSHLEIQSDGPLARLIIAPESVARLPLSAPSAISATSANLTTAGFVIPQSIPPDPATSIAAHLDAQGAVVAVAPLAGPAFIPVNTSTAWIAVAVGEYRTQTALFRRVLLAAAQATLSIADRDALRDTAWLSPFLQKSADALLAAAPQP